MSHSGHAAVPGITPALPEETSARGPGPRTVRVPPVLDPAQRPTVVEVSVCPAGPVRPPSP